MRVGWSGAQPWSLARLRQEGPRSPVWEEEGMAPVEEELLFLTVFNNTSKNNREFF
jgi:hypothetical protein